MIDLCIFGSPRKNQNTMKLVNSIIIDIDKIILVDKRVSPCRGCLGCYGDGNCIINDDFKTIIEKIETADRLVIASPLYFNSVTGILKNFIDRLQCQYAKKVLLSQKIRDKEIIFLLTSGSVLSNEIKESIRIQMDLVVKVLGGNTAKYFYMENLDREKFEAQIVTWKQKNNEIVKLFSIS